jgi:hypothetical protein
VGPRAGLDAAVKRKDPCPCRESNHGRPGRNSVSVLAELFYYGRVVSFVMYVTKKFHVAESFFRS